MTIRTSWKQAVKQVKKLERKARYTVKGTCYNCGEGISRYQVKRGKWLCKPCIKSIN